MGEGGVETGTDIQYAHVVDRSAAAGDLDTRQRGQAAEQTDSVSRWPARIRGISGVLAPPSIMAAAELSDNGCRLRF